MNVTQRRIFVSLLGLVLFCAACSTGSSSPAVQGNKTLVVESSFELDTLDPARGSGKTVFHYELQTYQSLLQVDPKDPTKLLPQIAQSYVVSPDGMTVTFKLRHDVRFSDGTPLTSADVLFTYNRMLNIKATPELWVHGETFAAPDPYTVVVTSATPNVYIAFFLAEPQTGILNSKVVLAHGGSDAVGADKTDLAEQYLNQQSAGSGPYVLDSVVPGSTIVLKTNPKYWGPGSAYSKVIFVNTPESTQVLDIQKNPDTIVLDLTSHDVSTLDKSKVNILSVPSLETWAIALNADPAVSTVTANQDIREAVRYGINYDALMNIAGQGAVRAQGILSTGVAGALPANQLVSQDVAKAKAFVAQSGLSNPSFALDYVSDETPGGVSYAAVAQEIQANLKDIGITVNLLPAPRVTLITKWRAEKTQALMTQIAGNSPYASTALLFMPGGLVAKWQGWTTGLDPVSDALVAKILAANTFSQQEPFYVQEQASSNEFAVYTPLLHVPINMVSSKSIGGLNVDGSEYFKVSLMT
jgi:peptide/nickel transport system substrate-binding protein